MLTVTVFSIRPGWITIPVLWVCSSMGSLSVQQTDRVSPWLIQKVRAVCLRSLVTCTSLIVASQMMCLGLKEDADMHVFSTPPVLQVVTCAAQCALRRTTFLSVPPLLLTASRPGAA